jgi:probable rRNA maturation factor
MDPEPATGVHPLHLSVQFGLEAEGLPSRQRLRAWAARALLGPVRATLRLVGDEEGLELNLAFRDRAYATNVLTFPYGTDPDGCQTGDIALCWPVVCREAAQQGKPVLDHCAHLVVHGMLHLQGLDHLAQSEADAMEALETRILAGLGLADPYRIPEPDS